MGVMDILVAVLLRLANVRHSPGVIESYLIICLSCLNELQDDC